MLASARSHPKLKNNDNATQANKIQDLRGVRPSHGELGGPCDGGFKDLFQDLRHPIQLARVQPDGEEGQT